MFENYRENQKEFYDLIYKSVVINNKVSHAYLIDTYGYDGAKELIYSFARFLLCKNHYVNNNSCHDCNLCSLIDSGVDDHIKVISAENGLWIKKEQLNELKDEFSKKSIDGLVKIYIIEEAEKLNSSSANSLLKFLEEPEEGIIAILVSSNRYKILPTIISRCQIYSLKAENSNVDNESYQYAFDFIMNLERNGERTICYINDLWFSRYKNKEEFIQGLVLLENVFLDLLKYKVKKETYFEGYIDEIEFITKKNSEYDLAHKLSVISDCKEKIQYNANLSLLMDKLIIEYCEVKNND